MIFQKISCENAPKYHIKVLTTKCNKDCILYQKKLFNIVLLYILIVCLTYFLQEPYAKIPQNHSFFFKTLETNIRSCYTIQTELSSDIHHFLYRNEDFYL